MSTPPLSPLAPQTFPPLPSIGGIKLATSAAGLTYSGRDDLLLIQLPKGTTSAGCFTRSLCPAAPVEWCRSILAQGQAQGLLCNAGNANAFTGKAGQTSVALTTEALSENLGIPTNHIYLASTGVIGEPLPDQTLIGAIPNLVENLVSVDADSWQRAANAIKTTDTFPKVSTTPIGDSGHHIVGIAKGSGMIAPDMATMLAFIFSDLTIPAPELQTMLNTAVGQSFNRITVDSDTSTSDTVLLFATATAKLKWNDSTRKDFQEALNTLSVDLAKQIVRDGEGATKLITVTTSGAETEQAAATISRCIAESPLVKTAIGAADANWGRIVMAVGKAGQRADRDRLVIWIGDQQVTEAGAIHPNYNEAKASQHLSGDEINIRVDVGVGSASATIWSCDLTHGYIDINASYRS